VGCIREWRCFVLPFYYFFLLHNTNVSSVVTMATPRLPAICPSTESATKPDMSIHSRATYLSVMQSTKRLKFAENSYPLYGVYLFILFYLTTLSITKIM
jgi:hypothetical protein